MAPGGAPVRGTVGRLMSALAVAVLVAVPGSARVADFRYRGMRSTALP
jgi:hypothetical protein